MIDLLKYDFVEQRTLVFQKVTCRFRIVAGIRVNILLSKWPESSYSETNSTGQPNVFLAITRQVQNKRIGRPSRTAVEFGPNLFSRSSKRNQELSTYLQVDCLMFFRL